jgi:hypothetical protein
MRLLASCLVVAFLGAATAAPPDALRLIPKEANLVVKVERPRALIEAVTKLDAYRGYEALPQVRELLDSTAAKRFFQLLAHAETKLGGKWPGLLDTLAGGGIALGGLVSEGDPPTLLVIQGTDEAKAADAFKLLVQLLNDELARQSGGTDKPAKAETGTHRGADTVHLGDDFFAARAGAALLVANKKVALDRGLALAAGEKDAGSVLTHATLPAAKPLLGGDPLAWLWFDLAQVKASQAAKDFFENARKEIANTVVVGGTVDAVRRADFVTAGLFQTKTGLRLSVAMPAKRADLPPELALHVPMKPDVPGTLPLLEPPGVLYSQSLYLDLATLWTDRKRLLNEQVLKDFEKGVADVSKVLPGTTVGRLLEMSGPHHRFVAVERGANPYKVQSDFPLPEMAVVSSMRDARFGKEMATTLRAAAAVASIQLGLKMTEETHDGVAVVSYRFPENKPLDADPTNLRFSFVPAFAVVGDSLVVASSPRLVKDLIPELRKPADRAACEAAVWRGKVYGAGAATALKARPEAVITDAVLGQGIGLDAAKKQVDELAKFLTTLGTLGVRIDHTAEAFRFDVEWKTKD